MGIIIPAEVACACPNRGRVAPPSGDDELVLKDGAWRLRTSDAHEPHAFREWAKTACVHGLVRAEAWPLLTDLLALRDVLTVLDGPGTRALGELAAAFCRLPREVGRLAPLTVDVDERHRRALSELGAALVTLRAIHLVDSDTEAVIAGPAPPGASADPPTAHGSILVEHRGPGPPYSFFTPFDARGLCVERDSAVVFRARRVTQDRSDGTTRLVDRDTGASVALEGVVAWRNPQADGRPEYPACFHVETRPLPAEHLATVRQELEMLVDAALETGHPVRMPDRFG